MSTFEENAREFFTNFIKNCETSSRLDSVQTVYFGHWAQSIMGMEHARLPSEDHISRVKVTIEEPPKT